MSYNNYLINLANVSNEIGYSLTYGHGDIAVTEINSLRNLLSKAEEMIPILEAEACFEEAEELEREERLFNYWMTMLYENGNTVSPVEARRSEKANRLKRRKQNKRHHRNDRYHGKDRYKTIKENNCCEILEGNISSCKKFIDSTDEMNGSWIIMNRNKKVGRRAETLQKVTYNRKTFRNRLNSAMDAREKDFLTNS